MNNRLLKNTLPILITSAVKPNDPNSVKLTSFELRRDYTINALKNGKKYLLKAQLLFAMVQIIALRNIVNYEILIQIKLNF